MRKSLLSIGLFAMIFAFAACCGGSKEKQEEGAEGCAMSEECKVKAENAEKWAQFETLEVEEQEALIAKRVECYTAKLEKCAEKKECAAKEELSEELAEKKAELKETWERFETLTLTEKKEFFDKVDCFMAKMKGCDKKDGEGCAKKDGEKCCKEGGDPAKCCKKEGKDCSKKCGK